MGLGLNLPTEEYTQTEPASCGQGYLSGLITTGGTYSFDEHKSWSLSALSRILVYGEQKDTDVTPGWEFIVDWGIGKQFQVSDKLLVRPGIAGYGYWQMGEDSVLAPTM